MDALPVLIGNLVMGNLVNRDYEPVLANYGDTVNVPIPPNMVANNILEGGSVQLQNPSLGNAQIVLNTHLECSFGIPDVTKMLATPDLLKVYMQPAVKAVAEQIETLLLNLYPGFTFNAATGAGNTAITEGVIDTSETALFKAKNPPSDQKFLIVYPDTYSAMRQIPRFSEYQTIQQAGVDALVQGQVAKVKDFIVVRSQYVPQTGAAGALTTHNLGFTKNAIALVMRRLPQPLPGTGAIAEYAELGGFGFRVVMSYNPNTLGQQFTVDALLGCGVLRNEAGIQVNS